jgi:hypothetical protein
MSDECLTKAGEDDEGKGNHADSRKTGHVGDKIACCQLRSYPRELIRCFSLSFSHSTHTHR